MKNKWTPVEKGLPEKSMHVWLTYIEDGVKKVDDDRYSHQIKEFLFTKKDVVAWMPYEEPEAYEENEEINFDNLSGSQKRCVVKIAIAALEKIIDEDKMEFDQESAEDIRNILDDLYDIMEIEAWRKLWYEKYGEEDNGCQD